MKRMSLCAIAAAAILSLATPGHAQDAPDQPVIEFMGAKVRIVDLDAAAPFYSEGLGLTLNRRRPIGGGRTELIFSFPDNPGPPFVLLVGPSEPGGHSSAMLMVTNIAELHERLTALGYAPGRLRANAAAGVQVFVVEDPEGNEYEIIQRDQPAGESSEG